MTLTVFRFATTRAQLWVLGQMALARLAFRRLPGCSFWKLCGSGGVGFAGPDWSVWAILAVWTDADAAQEALDTAPVYRRWTDRADESYTIFLAPVSARGRWSGSEPFRPGGDMASGPLAALTRATIRPARLMQFWRRAPAISDAIAANPDVIFKIGIGEVPVLHQVTFSVWPDAASMARFARAEGCHARAIRAVREGGWFREELYARFRVTGSRGTWAGIDPVFAGRAAA